MDYFKYGLMCISSGLLLMFLYMLLLTPTLSGAGGWVYVYFFVMSFPLLLGVADVIIGFIILFKRSIKKQTQFFLGLISLILGGFYIYMAYIFSWQYLIIISLLFISGFLIMYLKIDKIDSPST